MFDVDDRVIQNLFPEKFRKNEIDMGSDIRQKKFISCGSHNDRKSEK